MKRMAYEDYPDVLNAEQLAAMLGISRAGAYQLMNRADFPTPVSYTHLDVYKRQLMGCPQLGHLIILPANS